MYSIGFKFDAEHRDGPASHYCTDTSNGENAYNMNKWWCPFRSLTKYLSALICYIYIQWVSAIHPVAMLWPQTAHPNWTPEVQSLHPAPTYWHPADPSASGGSRSYFRAPPWAAELKWDEAISCFCHHFLGQIDIYHWSEISLIHNWSPNWVNRSLLPNF